MKTKLGSFKKVHENDQSATLEHDDGHRIIVSKKSLNKQMLKDLADIPHHMAEGGEVFDPGKNSSSIDDAPMEAPQVQAMAQPQGMDSGVFAQPAPQAAVQRAPAQVPQGPTNYQVTPQQQDPNPMAQVGMGQMGAMAKGYATQEAGIAGEARAAASQAEREAIAANEYSKQIADLQKAHQERYQKIDNEAAQVAHEMNTGVIDPNHFLENRSVMGKVSNAIGLILGGLGQGLVGGNNPAMDFINNQIDRDINSQKANLDKKQSVLNAYYKQLGNLNEATAMTKASYFDMYSAKIKEAAAKSGSETAKARAQQAIGQLQNEKTKVLGPLAMNVARMDSYGSGGQQSADRASQMIPTLPEHIQKDAYQELSKYQADKARLDAAQKAFDTVAKTKTAAYLAGHPQRAFSGAEAQQLNAAIVELARSSAKAYNPDEVEELKKKYMPKYSDTPEDIQLKRDAVRDHFMQEMHYPILQGNRILNTAQRPQPQVSNKVRQ